MRTAQTCTSTVTPPLAGQLGSQVAASAAQLVSNPTDITASAGDQLNRTYSIYCAKPDPAAVVPYTDPRLQEPNITSSTSLRTDLPQETLSIQACDATKLHKMHIPKFDSKSKQWTKWQRNFEVDMQSARVPRSSWVAIVNRYLDDTSYDAYEHWTT